MALTAEPPRPTSGPPGDDSEDASTGEHIPGYRVRSADGLNGSFHVVRIMTGQACPLLYLILSRVVLSHF